MLSTNTWTRREMLRYSSLGFGALACSELLAQQPVSTPPLVTPTLRRTAHFKARAQNVILLFMEGAVSQVDSYDPKPYLSKYHGQDPQQTIGPLEKTQFDNIGTVMASPWKVRQWGDSGIHASELFPHINRHMDELCIIRSMTSNFPEHTGANYFFHSGHGQQGRPSMGSWATYGLGTHNRNLPSYVVLNGGRIPSGGLDNFSNGFLPASFQGSLLNAQGTALANISPNETQGAVQQIKRDLARKLNLELLRRSGPVDALESAIANAELAARMQIAIPNLMDLNRETKDTHTLYGLTSDYEHTRTYGRACLIARRLVESGVRFVEVTIPRIEGIDRWDAHKDISSNHRANALAVDQPIAGLLSDLRRRGLLDQTLVVWSGEFGRTPFAQGGTGRDHNQLGFSLWMAGGGVKKGITYGATDEWGYRATENTLTIHDLHATILSLLGIDHERLVYRFGGRDIRLTDVYGNIISDIIS